MYWLVLVGLISINIGIKTYAQQTEAERLAAEFSSASNLIKGRYFEGEELLFAIHVERYKIGDVQSVAIASGIAFELESYLSVFDFPIDYEFASQQYKGWYISEDKRFSLSLLGVGSKELVARTNNKEYPLNLENYVYIDGQIFINAETLSEIFGIDHEFNLEKLIITATSSSPLPFLKRLARQKGNNVRNRASKPSFVNLPRGYEILSPQILDFQASTIYRESTDKVIGNYSIQGVRDLAQWSSKFSLTGNDINPLSASRLNFSRQSLNGQLFNNSGITQFEFGDVRDVRQASGSNLNESLGVRFTNSPILSGIETNTTFIDGDIPVGWDVELYRNNVLIEQSFDIQTGRYNFTDVPLLFGNNRFEIVLYGPQGQVRRRNVERLVDESTFSTKPFTYEMSITDTSKSLINSKIDDLRTDSGVNFSARAKYYLGNATSLDFGVRSQQGGDIERSVVNLGVDSVVFDNILVGSYLESDDNGVTNLSTNIRTLLYGQSFGLRVNANDINEELNSRQLDVSASVEGDISLGNGYRVPMSNQLRLFRQNDFNTINYSNSVGLRAGPLALFNTLNYEYIERVDGPNTNDFFGNVNLQANFGSVFARIGGSYSPDADETLTSAQASLSWRINNRLRSSLSYSKNFLNDNRFATANVSYLGKDFQLAARMGYSDSLGYDVGLNASFSLSGQHQYLSTIQREALSQSVTGMLSVRVFLDKNLNSVFDGNDVPLPNIAVKALQFYKTEITNDEGVATLTRLPNMTSSDITIDTDTLPDSFMKPRIQGVSITARSGLVDFLDFPVVAASELTGVVNIINEDNIVAGSRLKFDLLDRKGVVIDSAVTEFDGFYAFYGVIPGKYTLELNEDSRRRNRLEEYKAELIVDLLPDVFTKDIDLKMPSTKPYFISQIASTNASRFVDLTHKAILKKLKPFNIKVYRYQIHDTNEYVFYTATHVDSEIIDGVCERLLSIGIQCENRKLDVLLNQQ